MSEVAYINDVAHDLHPGETVLSFLDRHLGRGAVPTLCDAPQLAPFGSCRLCSVDVARAPGGPRRVVASCHTPATDGLRVYPFSDRVERLRRNIVELILTDHPLDCLTCEANGRCELQDVAARVGIRSVRYSAGKNHLDRQPDTSHPFLRSDLSKCINCYRCVRACDEVQGRFVLSMAGRGFDNRIIKGRDQTFAESDCVSCGACAQVCPTAAISDVYQPDARTVLEWTRTVCGYCGVGCNLEIGTRGGRVLSIRAPFDAEVNEAHTCLKGRYAFRFVEHPERLRTPLVRRNGSLEPASWDEAYDVIVNRLGTALAAHGPDSIGGISSSRCTNEENYLMQKLLRVAIGTNNIDGCARVCHAPTAHGMQKAFGTGAATNSIQDLKKTDLILICGANPTEGHPVTGARIKQTVLKGTPLIVIDPRKIEIARYATWHLQLRPGTNVALLNLMARFIRDAGLIDNDFLERRCEGMEEYFHFLDELDVPALLEVTGVEEDLIREAAVAYASAPRAMMFHGLGVTEHSQGSKAVMCLCNLAMITGNIGREGVGVNPLRGQNNVQGAADMGVQPHLGPGYLDVTSPVVRARYESAYDRPFPDHVGLTIPRMLEAARDGRLKALWITGEDLVQTDPDSEAVRKALAAVDFLVVQELFMTETASMANVVLPGASFLEKSGTFTNGERRVQRVNQAVPPIEGTKPDGQIFVDVMNRLGCPHPNYHPRWVLEEISRVVPFFEGIRWDNLGDNGKQWPVGADGKDTQILHQTTFKRGKGKLHAFPFEETREVERHRDKYPFILTTGRVLEHYNTGTMTRRTSILDIVGEDVLLIHPDDAARAGIEDGDSVQVASPRGEIVLRARISRNVKPGVLSTTFHFPELDVNRITSDVADAESGCPEYKVVSVRIRKACAV